MPQFNTEIDRKSASRLLGVSIRTIDRYIRGGKLFANQQNGRIWLDKKEVLNFSHEKLPVKIKKTPIDRRHNVPVTISKDAREERSSDPNFYRDLYEEAKRAISDYHQKIEQANYRIGQLESQIINTHGVPRTPERRDDSVTTELIRKDLMDREKEILILKDFLKRERSARIIFAILTYALLGILPLLWYLLR